MKILKKLDSETDVFALPVGTLVYVTDTKIVPSVASEPMLVAHGNKNHADCITFVDTKFHPWCYTAGGWHCEYGKDWWVEVENGFTVETPHGTLHAYDKNNSEYPGVMVDLFVPGDDVPIGLAMTEYIPSSSEGMSDYIPGQPMEMWAQFKEIPNRRIATDPETNDLYVTAGFVTRAWPDEVHAEDKHKRVFHFGYQPGHAEQKKEGQK